MKLLIRNLARNTTEAELQTLFEPYGKIQSCKLVADPKSGLSKGFGFIEMPNPGQAKAAVKTLNGKELGGNKIRVKKAESKPQSTDSSNKSDSVNKTTNPDEKTPPAAKKDAKDTISKYGSVNKPATPEKMTSAALKEKTKDTINKYDSVRKPASPTEKTPPAAKKATRDSNSKYGSVSKPAISDKKTTTDVKEATNTTPAPKQEKVSSRDPLHGVTLEKIVTKLEDKYGWEELGSHIDIKCFTTDPSISSSLKFLRKTPWAREKVEDLYRNTSWTKANVWDTARKNKKR